MSSREGYYIYGVMATGCRREFSLSGVGGRGDIVYTLPLKEIAAIVSKSPVVKYAVTRENVIAHARVLEEAVTEGTTLPVRFCTIAESEDVIVETLLKNRYQELLDLLRKMEGKIELGVRVRWTDINAIFAEVIKENKAIKTLKEALLSERNKQKEYAGKIKIGQLVQEALEAKKRGEAEELLRILRPISLDCKENKTYGDMNLLNTAFLVDKKRENEFDQKVSDLERIYDGRKQLKYTAPIIPYNFVEVVVNW